MSIKAVLASATILEESHNESAYITALIHSEENAEAAKIAGNGKAEVFYYQNSIARIMAHTSRQPGMSTVFTNLLSYAGDEIYVEKIVGAMGRGEDFVFASPRLQNNKKFVMSLMIGIGIITMGFFFGGCKKKTEEYDPDKISRITWNESAGGIKDREEGKQSFA